MVCSRPGRLYRSLTKRTIEMQKLIFTLFTLISAIAFATPGAIAQLQQPDQVHGQEQEKVKYTCRMHPEVVKDHPGKCPKCGMTLVPIKPDGKRPTSNAQHPTPNSEHGTHDANGMAMPQHEHQQYAEQEHEMHMSMQ